MSETVLVLNCGSSSVKYELIAPGGGATDAADGVHIAAGVIERIGEASARISHTHGEDEFEDERRVADHRDALGIVLGLFDEVGPSLADVDLAAVGHRVVMGGRRFDRPVLIDDEVLGAIEAVSPLAPLHNPPNLIGIEVARDALGELPHVAVFDTGFFRDLPAPAATYALNREVAEAHGIVRYGAHGTSHQYVSRRVAEILDADGRHTEGRSGPLRQIVLHLGNGASASAVVDGSPVETSMGFTPLEGLVMGTRTGDIDAAVVFHLARNAGMGIDEIDDLLNRRSGMLGLAGSNDMRDVHRAIGAGDADAALGLEIYLHRLRSYIGAYAAVMGGIDAVAFTAGVGENDAVVRAGAVDGLGFLGIEIDPDLNDAPSTEARVISLVGAPVTVLVVPTDEELEIARATLDLILNAPSEEQR